MNNSVADILNPRYNFEELLRNFDIPEDKRSSDINSLEWFKRYGNRKNRFRDGYKEAIDICNEILEFHRKDFKDTKCQEEET